MRLPLRPADGGGGWGAEGSHRHLGICHTGDRDPVEVTMVIDFKRD